MTKKKNEEMLGGGEDVMIAKQETITENGEIKIKYTLSDGEVRVYGM